MHGIRRYASIAVVFFLCIALHHCIVSMVPLNDMNVPNNLLLHEGHSLAYTTRLGGNGEFTTAIRDKCGISCDFRKRISQSAVVRKRSFY
jgi:hypothetical protein